MRWHQRTRVFSTDGQSILIWPPSVIFVSLDMNQLCFQAKLGLQPSRHGLEEKQTERNFLNATFSLEDQFSFRKINWKTKNQTTVSHLHKEQGGKGRETETHVNHLWGKMALQIVGKTRVKLKKAAVSKHVTRKLGKRRRKEVGYSGTWQNTGRTGSNFITFQCFQLPTVFQRENMQRRMIYWAIISFRPLLSECGQQRNWLNYICRVLRMSFLSKDTQLFSYSWGSSTFFLHNICNFHFAFLSPTRSSLTGDCLLHQVTKIIASTLCVFIQSLGSLFASSLFASCWFYPGLSAPQNIKSLMCGTIFPPFSSSHILS